MVYKKDIVVNCRRIVEAFQNGGLGDTRMPEDANPGFADDAREEMLAYFSLPMSLNYQRDSFKLWEAALATYNDASSSVTIQNIFLAYYLGEDPQQYAMPVYVFEGNNGFFAFVSAITEDQIKR